MKTSMNICILLILGVAIVAFTGCGDAGGSAKTESPVKLIASLPDIGQSLQSDVCTDSDNDGLCTFFEDEISVSLAVKPLNPDLEDTSMYMSVIATGYLVEFERLDTGTAVPKSFEGALSLQVEANEEIEFPVVVVRADMKAMPPLSYLWQFGYEPDTGLSIIHTRMKITFWGQTLAGESVVSNPVYLSVNFGNWAD